MACMLTEWASMGAGSAEGCKTYGTPCAWPMGTAGGSMLVSGMAVKVRLFWSAEAGGPATAAGPARLRSGR